MDNLLFAIVFKVKPGKTNTQGLMSVENMSSIFTKIWNDQKGNLLYNINRTNALNLLAATIKPKKIFFKFCIEYNKIVKNV